MADFKVRTRLGLGIALGVTVAVSALAQTNVKDMPAEIRKLIDCRKLTDDHARLACYDTAVDAITASLTKGDIVAVDKQEIANVRRQAFGFTLPSLNIFGHSDKTPALENISAVVERATQRGNGTWVIELEGGAVWSQIDDEPLLRGAHKGSKAAVRKAALGTYFMNIDGQRALRVKRVE